MARKKRKNLPETLYLCTRATNCRKAWLGTNPELVSRIVLYLLGVAGSLFKVRVLGVSIMSTHVHLVLYDKNGMISKFCWLFFRFTAILVNIVNGRFKGRFWDGDPPNLVELTHEQAIVDKLTYTMINPTRHQVTDNPEDYAGFVTTVDMIRTGKRYQPSRPNFYFRPDSTFPDRSSVTFAVPPGYSREEWADVVELALNQRLGRTVEDPAESSDSLVTASEGMDLSSGTQMSIHGADTEVDSSPGSAPLSADMGQMAGLADQVGAFGDTWQSFRDVPGSSTNDNGLTAVEMLLGIGDSAVGDEVLSISVGEWDLVVLQELNLAGDADNSDVLALGLVGPRTPLVIEYEQVRSELKPRFAGPMRLIARAIDTHNAFEAAHQLALERYRLGETDVEFPCGTVGMRQNHGVRVREMTPEERRARRERLRAPLHDNEVKYQTRWVCSGDDGLRLPLSPGSNTAAHNQTGDDGVVSSRTNDAWDDFHRAG